MSWIAQLDEKGLLSLCESSLDIKLQGCAPAIKPLNGEQIKLSVAKGGDDSTFVASGDGFTVTLTLEQVSSGTAKVNATVKNESGKDVALDAVSPLNIGAVSAKVAFDNVQLNGYDMNGKAAVVKTGEDELSDCVMGYTDNAGTTALVLGFTKLDTCFTRFSVSKDGPIQVDCLRDGVVLADGQSLELPPFVLYAGESLSGLMDTYAKDTAKIMGARNDKPVQIGWCSWYTYYGTDKYEDIIENIENFENNECLSKNLRVIQLDDGWNFLEEGTPKHRNWGDWEAGVKFPKGMKDIADRIKKGGFIPGLWLAPFSVDPDSNLFKEHPEWMVKDENGDPKNYWGVYGLDLTQQAVLDHVRGVFERVFNEWGFGYIKIDFLIHSIMDGYREDPTLTRAELFRRGIQVIREVAGDDNYILNCGSPMGPAIGVCDAMRIGPDISHRWYIPMNLGSWPFGNCNIYAGAKHTVGRQWMHQNWWQNDPDCLLVHNDGTAGERLMFDNNWDGIYAKEPAWGLSEEEASMWVRMIWFTGTMTIVAENIGNLNAERLALLEKTFPLNPHPARSIDLYDNSDVAVMKAEAGPAAVGFFNMSDEEVTVKVPLAKLGLKGGEVLSEYLLDETLTVAGDEVVQTLAPHSGRVWVEK